ncbi:hypothetical protein [Haladaptatus caseinilyticus]|uniref:hypothetical protein n=1 Tax=Haladaptatus caseinilyticus TaxID=2993314 RepID=UPI00224ADB16|nr:hypothetical protein [Haladaptatus caseinilyticus]
MQLAGFSLLDYRHLLETALEQNYNFYTVAEYFTADSIESPSIVLRHDVDRRVGNAVAMAELETELGIDATYYFRTSTFEPSIASRMETEGHEVGYHYEDLAKARGNVNRSHARFAANLESFRQHVSIETICSHGSPLSPHLNTDMWKDARTPADYDLLGKAYDIEAAADGSDDRVYFSDTGRDWNASVPGIGAIHETDDVIRALESGDCSAVYLLAHPSRWSTSHFQRVERPSWDLAAETGKALVGGVHAIQQTGGHVAEQTRIVQALRTLAGTGTPRSERE